MAKKCETKIVQYAMQEIQIYQKSTLDFTEDKLETITMESLKRRIEIFDNFVENLQQVLGDFQCFVIDGLEKYKKETLRIIEEDALKQVEENVNKISEKANNVTMEDLVNLIEKPLNQILKDCRKHAQEAVTILERNHMEYLEPLSNKLELDILHVLNKFKNEQQKYKEIIEVLEQEVSKHFREDLSICNKELKKQEEEAVEHLYAETEHLCEETVNQLIQEATDSVGYQTGGSEEEGPESFRQRWRPEVDKWLLEDIQRNVETMRNRVKQETQEIQKEALRLLSRDVKSREHVSWQKRFIEIDTIVEERRQLIEEKLQYSERKHEELFKEADEYIENVIERVREKAVNKVTEMVSFVVQQILRSALKHSEGSELVPKMETSPKWVAEALLSGLKGFHAKQVRHLLYECNC